MIVSFEERLRSLQLARGWAHPLTIAEMLDGWRAFIEQCEAAYEWGFYEYENDLSIRDRIALILAAADISNHAVVQNMAEQVAQLDRRFRSLLQEGVSIKGTEKPWWRRGVLTYSGAEYANDVSSLYSVAVEIR